MIKSFAEFSYGVLHWSPSDFWCSTPWDVFRAMAGWRAVNGVAKPKGAKLSRDEVAEIKHDLEMNKRLERKSNG